MIEYYNEDCMVGMARYPDKHFDLAIVDPPYGIGIAKWDVTKPNEKYFKELFRVSNNWIIWGANYFKIIDNNNYIVWDKDPFLKNQSKSEIAFCSFETKAIIYRYQYAGNFENGRVDYNKKSIHPTQKPVALYKWLLHNYAKKGDLILDTHVGSASSLIACHLLGFNAVGFELDEDYYRTSKERLDRVMNQLGLFGDGEETA